MCPKFSAAAIITPKTTARSARRLCAPALTHAKMGGAEVTGCAGAAFTHFDCVAAINACSFARVAPEIMQVDNKVQAALSLHQQALKTRDVPCSSSSVNVGVVLLRVSSCAEML